MGKCPYCKKKLHLEDFFEMKEFGRTFKGEEDRQGIIKMWVCPLCDCILAFSEVSGYTGTRGLGR